LQIYDWQSERWFSVATGELLGSLNWAKDSSTVYFQDQLDSQEAIFRANVTTKHAERVFGFGEILRGSAAHFSFSGLDDTGSFYVMVERGGTDIYALDLELP
jgi:hypothetical protein